MPGSQAGASRAAQRVLTILLMMQPLSCGMPTVPFPRHTHPPTHLMGAVNGLEAWLLGPAPTALTA